MIRIESIEIVKAQKKTGIFIYVCFCVSILYGFSFLFDFSGIVYSLNYFKIPANQTTEEITELFINEPVEKELFAKQSHKFQISMRANQFFQIKIEQKGIKILASLVERQDNLITETSRVTPGHNGTLIISAIAGEASTYQLIGRASEPNATKGKYQIILEQQREVILEDYDLITAERAFEAGRKLYELATQQSRLQAIDKFQEALTYYRKVTIQAREAESLQALGFCYRIYGDLTQAKAYYEQSLSLQRKIGDRRGENLTLLSLGLTHHILGNFQIALEYYQQSLVWFQNDNDRVNVARTLNNLGGLYDSIGELQKALDIYNQALQFHKVDGNLLAVARIHNNIGISYDKLGDTQQALDHYQQTLNTFKELKDDRNEALTLSNIGYVYASLSDSQKAFEYYQQALETGKDALNPLDKAPIISNIGYVYESLGEYQRALDYYNQALQIQQTSKQPYAIPYTLINIGHVQATLGETIKARETYLQALAILQEIGDSQGEASVLQKLGELAAITNNQPQALEYSQKALKLWRDVRDQRGEATTLYNIARIEFAQNNLSNARIHINQAIELVESLRGKVANQGLRSIYFGSIRSHYDLAIDLLMQLHKKQPEDRLDVAAFELSERARARSLVELLVEARADIHQGVDQTLINRLKILQEKLNVALAQLQNLKSKDNKEQKNLSEKKTTTEKEISTLLTQYQQVETEIKTSSPRYAALTQPQPFNLKEIQQLLDNETILLEYTLSEERSYLWLVSQDKLQGFQLPKRAEIEALTRQTYDLLVTRNQIIKDKRDEQRILRWQKADAEFPIIAAKLSNMLLGPIADQLANKRLLIVADGALQSLPFAVLPIPTTATFLSEQQLDPVTKKNIESTAESKPGKLLPLISEHEVINLPSASTLLILRRELQGRKPAEKTLAIFADPVFDKKDARIRDIGKKRQELGEQLATRNQQRAILESGLSEDGVTMARLVFTRREAEAITSMAGNRIVKKSLDFDANRATAVSEGLSQYQIVHFATHALLNNKHPELSSIVLSLYNEQGEPENGFLQLNEIYNLKLPAELVVLSACQTGLGKEIRGEGLIGLTRGFMYAGAARIIASLWKIDDAATAELMKRFYQHILVDKQSSATALRNAQLEMARQPRWQSPYYWAGFVLQGEFR